MAAQVAGPGPVTLTAVTTTRLEKVATDNGFDLELEHTSDWLSFGSSQTPMRIWLTARGESRFLAAMSRSDVLEGLDDPGVVFTDLLPSGAVGAASVRDIAALHRLLRRAFQLSRTLPDGLLHVFETEAANLPRSTEAERLVVQRVGQDIFRRGLLEYWDGRCAITGLDVPDLLRASHVGLTTPSHERIPRCGAGFPGIAGVPPAWTMAGLRPAAGGTPAIPGGRPRAYLHSKCSPVIHGRDDLRCGVSAYRGWNVDSRCDDVQDRQYSCADLIGVSPVTRRCHASGLEPFLGPPACPALPVRRFAGGRARRRGRSRW